MPILHACRVSLSPGSPEFVASLFALVGLVFAAVGIGILRGGRRRARSWTVVPGTVVGARWDRNNDSRYLEVSYTGPDGLPRTFVNRYGSTMLRVPTGQQVRVLVNPAKPDDAVLTGARHGGGCLGLGFFVLGGIFAVVGVVVLVVALR